MEEEVAQTISQTEIINLIMSVINEMFSNLFSSIDNTIYSLLDEIVFVNSDLVITQGITNIFSSSKFNILILANILLSGLVIYHIGKIVLSLYTHNQTELPYMYILKVTIYAILLNSSLYICEKIIDLNSLICQYLSELGTYLFDTEITFISFINSMNDLIAEFNSFTLFSIDGVIKCMITFGFISLLISYILRFILIKLLVICSPFAFLCLLSDNLKPYFSNWLKYLISLLILQNIVIVVMYIPHILNFENDVYSKFLIIGVIYTLHNLNNYLKEFLGGFNLSNNISLNTSSLQSLFKK